MIKETVIPTSTIYPLSIPKDWVGKPVTIFYDEEVIERTAIQQNENAELKKKSLGEAKAFFDSIRLDFSNFKFDRDEANER